MKNTAIIIPTRLGARRFPNKPLVKINNVPMIIHVLNRAKESEVGDVTFKPEAGHAVVYPGGSLHSIQEVTKGIRLVAATWIQSIIVDPAKRQLLLELDMAAGLVSKNSPNSDEARILAKTHGNLMRMWSEI